MNKILKNTAARVFLCLLLALWLFGAAASAQQSAPAFFDYAELTTLYEKETLSPPLQTKLDKLLTTPFVDNSYRSAAPLDFSTSAALGKFMRVAEWNIERGLEYEAIAAAFGSQEELEAMLDNEKFPVGSEKRRELLEQAAALRAADVIILNEVDLGMKRSEYRSIAADLAAHLKMNYAFGAEFVELSPVHLSRKSEAETESEKEIAELIRIDPARYRGLHGTAILSRFPLENVRLIPFKNNPYDWYEDEKKGASLLEKGKRKLGSKVFLEDTLREVRRGGRAMLFADIVDAQIPGGRVTIAAAHLENRTKSKNRVKQLNELLAEIKQIPHPVVVAGDMNTSCSDLTPTSLRREIMKRYGNPRYWIKQGINYALGIGIVEDFLITGISFGRTYADPTVRSVPFFLPNDEYKFFKTLKKFRFADGGAFDFRGDAAHSTGEKKRTLANSNERGKKGFITTFQLTRPIYPVGKYKLDWIFVKPADLKSPDDNKTSYQFAPHFGRTLRSINEIVKDRVSDHRPIIVDLPLNEPPRQ